MLSQGEKKRLQIMGGITLVLIAVAVVNHTMRMIKARQFKKNTELALPQAEQLRKEKTFSPRFLEKQQAQQALLKQDWGRNPFAKTDVTPKIAETVREKPVKEAQFILEGIILRDSGKVALINGELLREGDAIQDALVKSIEEKKVIIEKKDKEITLQLAADTLQEA